MTLARTRAAAAFAAIAVLAALLAVAVVGSRGSSRGRAPGSFAWLQPTAAPGGWRVAHTTGGAVLAYPPGWTAIKTDPGSASVALLDTHGRIEGFLNATPEQGGETLANWSRFRPQHNSNEGSRGESLIASTTSTRFRGGHGSCVIDTYTNSN